MKYYIYNRRLDTNSIDLNCTSLTYNDYTMVYKGDIENEQIVDKILEDIFYKFQHVEGHNCPDDYAGRSLSVGDVIVLENKYYKMPFVVKGIGFEICNNFFKD